MEARVRLVRAKREHAIEMAPHVRIADQREIWASLKLYPVEALQLSIQSPGKHYAALFDGKVAAIFGICPDESGGAAIWLIGTDTITQNGDLFKEYVETWLNAWKKKYTRLYNWVDARNEVALRWAESVGIKASANVVAFGMEERPFHYVEWRRTS